MKRLLSLSIAVLLSACSTEVQEEARKNTLDYSTFKNTLRADMNFDAIVKTFGTPAKDIGSGIHIYVYKLNDNTEIWIGYVDKILYARHLDQNQKLLHTLL